MANNQKSIAVFTLRIALAVTLLSSVASRLGLWGAQSSGWEGFLAYTADVNAFVPDGFTPFLAITATGLEILFGLLLLAGYKMRLAASGTAVLTLIFAVAMAISLGLKSSLDYSVFAFSAAAWVLAVMPGPLAWSLDELFIIRKPHSPMPVKFPKTNN